MPLGLDYTIVKTEEIARSCGHTETFEYRDPDRWQAERLGKFRGRPCRDCMRDAIAILERAAGGGPPRLPYGDILKLMPQEIEDLVSRHAFEGKCVHGCCYWKGSIKVWLWFIERGVRIKAGYNADDLAWFFSFRVELPGNAHEWVGCNGTSLALAACRALLVYVCRAHPRQVEAKWPVFAAPKREAVA